MKICVVIPIYKNKADLHHYEKIALEQCCKMLNKYSLCFIGPGYIDWKQYSDFLVSKHVAFDVKIFPDYYFGGIGGYSRLLLSPKFYRAFKSFHYILIHQTDAFIFKDEIETWCSKGYHFIGAPWFEGFSNNPGNKKLVGVGNGGFSLRKVATHLRVLNSFSYVVPPATNWKQRFKSRPTGKKRLREFIGFMLDLCCRNNTFWLLNTFRGFEDQFWGLVAARNFSWYKVPDCHEAMKFSFEMQPRELLMLNNNQLPSGCHAWWKYDIEFWKPYIEQFGYKL